FTMVTGLALDDGIIAVQVVNGFLSHDTFSQSLRNDVISSSTSSGINGTHFHSS
ncbi:hypothetical protein OG21DRAFT_1420863, partial [Imleria badia]